MTLKGIKNLGFVLFIILFAACGSSSSSDSGGDSNPLVGTWNLTGYNSGSGLVDVSGSANPTTRVMTSTAFTDTEPSRCTTVGTYTTSGGNIDHTVTTATSTGDKCANVDGDTYTVPYTLTTVTVADDTLTFTWRGRVWVYTKQ